MYVSSRSAVKLGYILKHVPGHEFSVDEFDDRLRFQKTVYLLQAFGINRGYDFSWYLRGPYRSLAAHGGYDQRDAYDSIPAGKRAFKSGTANKRFKRFCKFAENRSTEDLGIGHPRLPQDHGRLGRCAHQEGRQGQARRIHHGGGRSGTGRHEGGEAGLAREARTLKFDADLGPKMPAGSNSTDLVTAHVIIDAGADEDGEPLTMHGTNLFNTGAPAEPVALKDREIIKIACRSERQGVRPHGRSFADRQSRVGPVHRRRRAVPEEPRRGIHRRRRPRCRGSCDVGVHMEKKTASMQTAEAT